MESAVPQQNESHRPNERHPAVISPAVVKTPPRDLEELFQRHHGLVFQAAYRITGSASDAEDVLQTVFLRLLRREDSAQGGVERLQPNPEGYLHRSAVNAALDLVRARARSRQVPFEDSLADHADGHRGPEGALRDREIREWLRRAVAGLGGRAAEIFALRYLEGLSNPQIASLLSTSQAVIAVTLHRTRGRLRKEIRPLLGDSR